MPEIPTTQKLATALEAIGAPPAMIQRARDGYYDDYKSPLALPQTALVGELRQLGTTAARRMISQVIGGEFDGTRAEAAEWRRSPEGQQAIREIFGIEFDPDFS